MFDPSNYFRFVNYFADLIEEFLLVKIGSYDFSFYIQQIFVN